MKRIDVNLVSNPYSIFFINWIDEILSVNFEFAKYNKVLIVTDDVVADIYLNKLIKVLKNIVSRIYSYTIANGEKSKNNQNAIGIINYMVENGFHRNDLIIAFGGGVVGDLSGYVASIFMRGIDFVQMPTTLLSSVDASIGGKTAIDIPLGKNLIGTFHQPVAVIETMSIIEELPIDIFQEGISEVIKYGAIYDREILKLVESGIKKNLPEIILRCTKAKAEIVVKDEKESGLRKILNFGHTLAHAIEQCSEYSISHGKAVAYGMIFECFISYKKNYCSKIFYDYLFRLIKKYFKLDKLDYAPHTIIKYMLNDKKNCDSKIVFAIPTETSNIIIGLEPDDVFMLLKECTNGERVD